MLRIQFSIFYLRFLLSVSIWQKSAIDPLHVTLPKSLLSVKFTLYYQALIRLITYETKRDGNGMNYKKNKKNWDAFWTFKQLTE